MLKDITLGQYFPGTSVIHRLDPRTKLLALIVYIVSLFMANNVLSYALCIAFLLTVLFLSRIQPKLVLKSLKPVVFIVILTAVLNMLYTPGDVLWGIAFIKITKQGIRTAIYMALRITLLITSATMLTYTTSPISLTDAIENLLSPLKKVKVPVHEFAMMMTIALRFIPTLIEETGKIMSAQKARGADFESGSLFARAKALVPVLVPLFISAFRRADELAVAMECRLYRGGHGRTRLHQLKYTKLDLLGGIVVVLVCAGIIVLSRVSPV